MDILLDNPLATMYGPYFLILYGFLIFFTLIVLAIYKSQVDKTNNLSLPPIPAQVDQYEIAYLRGGINEVARSVIFALMQKGFIEILKDGTKTVINKTSPPTRRNLIQIEQLALDWHGNSREPKEVFESNGLVAQLEGYRQMYQARLEQGQMLTGDDMRSSLALSRWAAYLVIFGFGAYKLLASIAHGYYNVILLVIFSITGLVIAASIARLPRVTKLGKAYLERLQLAFDNLKYQAQAPYIASTVPRVIPQQATFAGVDPLLLSVGVFGSAILAGTVFDSYNQTFQRAQQQSTASSCSSGCGSSCSSESSCSSGDSGGSSCGGGCGGGGD